MTNLAIQKNENKKSLLVLFQNALIIIICLFQIYSLTAYMQRNPSGVRISNYVFFGAGILLYFSAFFSKKIVKHLFLPLIMFAYVILTSFFQEGDFNTYIAGINFALMLTTFCVGRSVLISKKMVKFISFVLIIIGLEFVFFYFSPNAYAPYVEYTSVSDVLTLGFSNPNQTGIILFLSISISVIAIDVCSRKFIKFLYYILVVFLLILLVLTDARTSIIAAVFVITWKFFGSKFKIRNEKFVNVVSIGFIALPLVFFIIYLSLFLNGYGNDVVILGKSLFSGRQRVYSNVLVNWNNHIFGNVAYFRFSNAHNGALTIIVNTGIVGFFLYLITLYLELQVMCHNAFIKRVVPISLIIIYGILLTSCGEAAIVTDGNVYYVFTLLICLLFNYEIKGRVK